MKLMAQYAQNSAPPEYTPPLIKCDFCHTKHPETSFRQHLVVTHSELIFLCEECNKYVDRKEFLMHMSLHAIEYNKEKEKKQLRRIKKELMQKENDVNQNLNVPVTHTPKIEAVPTIPKLETVSSSPKPQTVPTAPKHQAVPTTPKFPAVSTIPKPEAIVTAPIPKPAKTNEENAFSDHSDTENGFDPLPESVFEAIEDTQNSRASEGAHFSPEHSTQNDESNITDSPSDENGSKKLRKRPRTCPICSKVYTASSSFFYHMRYTHKRVKDHECDICSKKFATRASLKIHATTHTGICQFECKHCGKTFRTNAGLYIHEQTHIGVKTWACAQCHRSFRWKTHLRRHMSRHLAEKAHVCSTCGRGFSIRCDLLRHARTHTAGSFACDKCDVKFAQLRYLKVHLEKKHSKKDAKS